MNKFADGCYSPISIFFTQLKSLLLALSTGLYKRETSRNTHLFIRYKGIIFNLFFPQPIFFPCCLNGGYSSNLVFLSMSMPVNKAGLGHGFRCGLVVIHTGGQLACSLVPFWLRIASTLQPMPATIGCSTMPATVSCVRFGCNLQVLGQRRSFVVHLRATNFHLVSGPGSGLSTN